MKLVLAIDIGTSSVRAGLVDEALTIRSVASRPCPLDTEARVGSTPCRTASRSPR